VTLRTRLTTYLVLIHALFMVIALVLIDDQILQLVVELVLLLSALVGARLARAVLVPSGLIEMGSQLVSDRDFSLTFQPVGQPEVDQLIEVYNRMIRQLREERLRAEEQHFFLEKLLAASPIGVLTCAPDDRITLVNQAAAQLLKQPPEQLVGRTLGELGQASPLAAGLAGLAVGAAEIMPWQGSRRLRCQRAEYYDLGILRSFYLIEELTEELRQSQRRAYERVIRMMSHEVNNSIGAISSLLNTGIDMSADLANGRREDFQRALQVAIERSDHLRSFMSSFAEVVRLPDPERRPCHIDRLLDDILLLMAGELSERGITCQWQERRQVGRISIDKNQFEQVLINILKNAAEAIGSDGVMTLRLLRSNGRPCLEIEDDGPGIAAAAQAGLFTPFFSTKQNGRGIGLTLVQEILARHGFDFALESTEGGPTCFRIWF
jgi:nitrogen fixation/metabolism regulation signal transduction histidine kinase